MASIVQINNLSKTLHPHWYILSIRQHICMCDCLSVSLSAYVCMYAGDFVCLSLFLARSLFVCRSVCLSICLSLCISVISLAPRPYTSVCQSVIQSIRVRVSQSTCPSFCLCIYLSFSILSVRLPLCLAFYQNHHWMWEVSLEWLGMDGWATTEPGWIWRLSNETNRSFVSKGQPIYSMNF